MSRQVLLIDPDVDALGALSAKLRARGLTVVLADSIATAVERSRTFTPQVLLIAQELETSSEMARLDGRRNLANVPRFFLAADLDPARSAADQLVREDAEAIAKRIYALSVKSPDVVADRGDFRGDLKQVGIVDLLQLLSMNRRTGSLSITTAAGAGEVRIADGEIVDAVYRRLEGEKALFRLLNEQEGGFAFAGGSPSLLRRVQVKTSTLLLEGLRQADEVKRHRDALAAEQDALLSIAPPAPEAREAAHRVAEVLTVPRTLDELLDDVALPDLEIVEALKVMLEDGSVRRIAKGAVRVEFADTEHQTLLGALVKRHTRGSFKGAARMVLAGSPRLLATVSHAVSRISDAVPPAESVPAAPVPHLLATLKLADGVELDIVGLPEIDAYSPLWGLTLPGSVVTVRLDQPQSPALDEACAMAGVPLLDGRNLVGSLDEADPAQVASLLRGALDSVAAP